MKTLSVGQLWWLVVRRDVLLAMRRRADVFTTLIFFVMVVSLFPLGVGSEIDLLRKMAPGVLWVAALLASMLSMGRLFAADYADGTLEQAVASLGHVAEGVYSAPTVLERARAAGVEMPITHEVNRVLSEGLSPREAVENLLSREPKAEH